MKRNLVNLLLMYGLLTLMCSVAWATPYEFNFTGEDLAYINTNASRYDLGSRMLMVYQLDNGSYQMTDKYYSDEYNTDTETQQQFDWLRYWGLVDFSLDPNNSATAQVWGQNQSFTILSASVNDPWNAWKVEVDNGAYKWYTDDLKYAVGFGIPPNFHAFYENKNIKFSFIADVSNPNLIAWFGSTLNNPGSLNSPYKTMKYEGAMELQGNPVGASVPEPATLVLLGISLTGLLFAKREKK